ncbi:MAG: hypothetical protein AAF127_15975 [Pseudomonadota bacterium]
MSLRQSTLFVFADSANRGAEINLVKIYANTPKIAGKVPWTAFQNKGGGVSRFVLAPVTKYPAIPLLAGNVEYDPAFCSWVTDIQAHLALKLYSGTVPLAGP